MVDIVSILIGLALVPLLVVVTGAFVAAYLYGKQTVSESDHYVNVDDVETYRGESVRDEELQNTINSVQDERPVAEIGTND